MTPYWTVFSVHLLLFFVICHLVALVDLRLKRVYKGHIATNKEEPPADTQFYLANFWYLQNRWLEFLYPFFGLLIVFSTMGAHVFFDDTKSTFAKIGEYLSFVIPAMALLGIPIIIVRHFFGHRIGFRLFLYPEFGITDHRLYYRFFVRWRSVTWDEIQGIQLIKSIYGQTHGYDIRLKSPNGIPTYPIVQVWKRTKTSNLIFSCLLPNALELKEAIERHAKQLHRYAADSLE